MLGAIIDESQINLVLPFIFHENAMLSAAYYHFRQFGSRAALVAMLRYFLEHPNDLNIVIPIVLGTQGAKSAEVEKRIGCTCHRWLVTVPPVSQQLVGRSSALRGVASQSLCGLQFTNHQGFFTDS
jgi:hypothetical protein